MPANPEEATPSAPEQPQGVGTLTWPPAGTSTWPLTTLARTARRVRLHLSTRSPWAALTITGLGRLADLAPG